MHAFSHSLISLIALLGSTPLTSSLSVPKNEFVPRQASPEFKCEYQAGWEMCNEQGNRQCWVRSPEGLEFNNSTNYEDFVPEGITRIVHLNLTQLQWNADGTIKHEAKLFNQSFPGPLIEACWGDTVIVNVKNDLPKNGTTIHWHGLRHLNENHMDGVNGITQCPTPHGQTMQYKFRVRQYGTSWYHSHYSSQYSDGALGPMVIHGPHNEDWDEELEPIMVTDWIHKSAFEMFHIEMKGGLPPQADSILVNGKGRFDGKGSYYQQKFKAGKKYLVRIINGSTALHFNWSLDNHVIRVIAADFVPIEPYTTNSLSVGIGQRYTAIIEANPTTNSTNGKYWMRTEYTNRDGCNVNIIGAPSDKKDTQRVGIVSYEGATSEGDPITSRYNVNSHCFDETPKLVPSISWTISPPQNDVKTDTYEAGIDRTKTADNKNKWHGAVARWSLTDTPMWLDFSNPTIMNLQNSSWNPEYGVVHYNQTDGDNFVYMVITYGSIGKNPQLLKSGSTAHPIHLHGHDFAIIGQGNTTYDPETTPDTFNLENPPRRDVAMLPKDGYLAIAFKPDNPGAWVVHCHIAWHAGSGLALQVLERQDEIENTLVGGPGVLGPVKDQCDSWKTWLKENPDKFDPARDQEDSGI